MSRAFAVLFLSVLIIGAAPSVPDAMPDWVTPEQAAQLASAGAVIVDVRTPAEWNASGVPAGAALVDLVGAPSADAFVASVLNVVGGDRTRPVITICRTNNRSRAARDLLRTAGFSNVASATEGVVASQAGPGWIGRGLPSEPCATC